MLKLLILILGMAFARPATFSKQQWEAIMTAQYDYAYCTTADSTQKLNTLIAVSLPVKGMTKQQVEDRLDEIYGTSWKTAGTIDYEVCRFICGVIYSVCEVNYKWCSDNYRQCLNFCRNQPPLIRDTRQ